MPKLFEIKKFSLSVKEYHPMNWATKNLVCIYINTSDFFSKIDVKSESK